MTFLTFEKPPDGPSDQPASPPRSPGRGVMPKLHVQQQLCQVRCGGHGSVTMAARARVPLPCTQASGPPRTTVPWPVSKFTQRSRSIVQDPLCHQGGMPDPSYCPCPQVANRFFSSQEVYGLGDPSSLECVICLTEPKDAILLPCRHFCVCRSCLHHISK
jgi:hypothetical protein